MEWYDYSEAERVSQVYAKHSIADFWKWWSRGKNAWMEVRFKTEYSYVKEVAEKLHIPRGTPGVYVNNADELKKVITLVREKTPVWFGINPRRKAYNKWGSQSLGGRDANVAEIGYLFFDIDRTEKKGQAQPYELKNAYTLAKLILEKFGKVGCDKSYCIICSGNGVQLLIQLDVPICLPVLTYDKQRQMFEYSEEFDRLKNIIKEGIGKETMKFAAQYESTLKVNIDSVALNIGRVGALPVTKNFKYGGFTWRGIVEMQSGVNEGLSDYILSKKRDKPKFKEYTKKAFTGTTSQAINNYIEPLVPGKLSEHPLVQSFRYDFDWKSVHDINNRLWLGFKMLLCIYEFYDIKTFRLKPEYMEEVMAIHAEFSSLSGRGLPMNVEYWMFTVKMETALNKINETYLINLVPLKLRPLLGYNLLMTGKYPIELPAVKDIVPVQDPVQMKESQSYESAISGGKEAIAIVNGERDEPGWEDLRDEYLESQRNQKVNTYVKRFASGFLERYGKDTYQYMLECNFFYRAFNFKEREKDPVNL
jgi:hypothetical protein